MPVTTIEVKLDSSEIVAAINSLIETLKSMDVQAPQQVAKEPKKPAAKKTFTAGDSKPVEPAKPKVTQDELRAAALSAIKDHGRDKVVEIIAKVSKGTAALINELKEEHYDEVMKAFGDIKKEEQDI